MQGQVRRLLRYLEARELIDSYECHPGSVVIVAGLNVCRLSYRRAVAFAKGALQAGEVHDEPLHGVRSLAPPIE